MRVRRNYIRADCCRWVIVAWLVCMTGCCCGLRKRGPFDRDVVAAELSRLGLDAMHRNSLSEAYDRFVEAVDTCPDDTESRYHLAKVLWKQGRREEAIEKMDLAIRSAGGDASWVVELGQMLLAEQEHAGALECAQRA